LEELLEPSHRPYLARIFHQSCGATKVLAAIGGHQVAMRLHLFGEFPLKPPAVQSEIETSPELSHSVPQASRRTAWMAAVACSYSFSSRLSCFAPAGVSL